MRLKRRESEWQCPLCMDVLSADDVHTCPSCQTATHRSCARELGGCPTLGCADSSGAAVERARSLEEAVQDKLTEAILHDIDEVTYATGGDLKSKTLKPGATLKLTTDSDGVSYTLRQGKRKKKGTATPRRGTTLRTTWK